MTTIASNKLECRYHLDQEVSEYLNANCSERGKGAFVSIAIRHYIRYQEIEKQILSELKAIGKHLGLKEEGPLSLKKKLK
jgi:hypothetical protein